MFGFLGFWPIRGEPRCGTRTLSHRSSEYLNSFFFGVVLLMLMMLAAIPELKLVFL